MLLIIWPPPSLSSLGEKYYPPLKMSFERSIWLHIFPMFLLLSNLLIVLRKISWIEIFEKIRLSEDQAKKTILDPKWNSIHCREFDLKEGKISRNVSEWWKSPSEWESRGFPNSKLKEMKMMPRMYSTFKNLF